MKKKLIVILIILIIIGASGYFIYQNDKKQDPFELEWIKLYYEYLKNNKEELKKREETLKVYRTNERIQFCKINNIGLPIMLYNYEELGQTFTNVLYIDDYNKVKMLDILKKDLTVEYLFDIKNNTYDYYIHEISGDEESYLSIYESIKANELNENQEKVNGTNIDNVFKFNTKEKISVTTLDGRILEISKFEQKFIKTTLVENNWKSINLNTSEDEVKKEFRLLIKQMQEDLPQIEKEKINKKSLETETKVDEMIKAIEEIEEKQKEEKRLAEEEARKKAEEEVRKKAEEEARKKAEEEARKKAEEEARKKAEEQRQEQETNNRKIYIKIWNI